MDRSTPSHRYPGMIPKRFGAGGGPLYLGYSENSKKTRFFKKMIEKNCNGNVTQNKQAHSSEMRGLCSTNIIFFHFSFCENLLFPLRRQGKSKVARKKKLVQ